ncbi:hypothetical protein CC2G_009990 [Coprinopsis cinerea AmutBmut pab1-1]|nr:hypothetical protein CC2G_009990 [Coprinopsis cinerea AmutBmut pab1-1]
MNRLVQWVLIAAAAPLAALACPTTMTRTTGIARHEYGRLEERAVNECQDLQRKQFIDKSYIESKVLALSASNYISTYGAEDALYAAYWSSNDPARIRSVYDAVAAENSTTRTLDCNDPYGLCEDDVLAYALFIESSNIFYCDTFFKLLPTSSLCNETASANHTVTRGGATLHELTHAIEGTADLTYRCSYQGLSPEEQVKNADNYNCFAEAAFVKMWC